MQVTLSLLGKHTNTYTFTKNLAEQLVASEGKDLPVVIVRPSMGEKLIFKKYITFLCFFHVLKLTN
jgi:nucleoside-diphosphate-sugar epimerase